MTIGSIKAMTTRAKVMDKITTTMTTTATKIISMEASKIKTSKMAISSNNNMIANTSNTTRITTHTIHKVMVADNIIKEEAIMAR